MRMLAFDLGASSGKMFIGDFSNGHLKLDVVKRFDNQAVTVRDELFWDALKIYEDLKSGIADGLRIDPSIVSLGLDSYSNDFGLLDEDGRFLNQVHCYRDDRTKRNEERIYSIMSKEAIHHYGGNQNALFGTLMQLASMKLEKQGFLLDRADKLLFLPDLFAYFLTGEICSEYTISSVSQMLDFSKMDWSTEILTAFDLPRRIFQKISQPGTRVGKVSGTSLDVIAVCEHDTASAFLAAPLGEDSVIVSSGTWSLVGVESTVPIINDFTFSHNIANEGGYPGGHHRLLKNVMGLWLIQECQRWYRENGNDYSIEELLIMAQNEIPFRYLIDPNDKRFFSPGEMPKKITEYCTEKKQDKPYTPGQVIRCILESLAFQYRVVIEELQTLTGRRYARINIVGGGSNNRLLNQFAANATGMQVVAGPSEATAIGNLLVQLLAHGEISSVAQGRQIIQKSFKTENFDPENLNEWDDRYKQYLQMIKIEE
jgi:rhamnulokinase